MIGGNRQATIEVRTVTKNAIGEQEENWSTAYKIRGWLDLQNGDSKHTNYNAKLQESTHVFLSEYKAMDGVTAGNSRLVLDGRRYEILLVDNPMEMNEQLEIYLKYTGGQ